MIYQKFIHKNIKKCFPKIRLSYISRIDHGPFDHNHLISFAKNIITRLRCFLMKILNSHTDASEVSKKSHKTVEYNTVKNFFHFEYG